MPRNEMLCSKLRYIFESLMHLEQWKSVIQQLFKQRKGKSKIAYSKPFQIVSQAYVETRFSNKLVFNSINDRP